VTNVVAIMFAPRYFSRYFLIVSIRPTLLA
jgi:hypothetical protein